MADRPYSGFSSASERTKKRGGAGILLYLPIVRTHAVYKCIRQKSYRIECWPFALHPTSLLIYTRNKKQAYLVPVQFSLSLSRMSPSHTLFLSISPNQTCLPCTMLRLNSRSPQTPDFLRSIFHFYFLDHRTFIHPSIHPSIRSSV
ncbi:unnamed protein product, partial [Laminaria digitata]